MTTIIPASAFTPRDTAGASPVADEIIRQIGSDAWHAVSARDFRLLYGTGVIIKIGPKGSTTCLTITLTASDDYTLTTWRLNRRTMERRILARVDGVYGENLPNVIRDINTDLYG